MKLIRPDFIFSYWVLGWVFCFMCETPINIVNPYFALIIISTYICVTIFIMAGTINWLILCAYIVSNIIIKVFPLLIVPPKIAFTDVWFTIQLFACYNLWLVINNTSFFAIYTSIYKGLLSDNPVDLATYCVMNLLR